ncbi:hypothetical protein AB0C18_12360 [Nonomuraea muscovyensis]|uniref:hypothetical protein n=1 Tax=Nonomuraea muscovyensis TaxID=1124761 RepID=UPI0033F57195
MSHISASVHFNAPRAGEMELATSAKTGALFLHLSEHDVTIILNSVRSDVAAEIAAMDRLAELASEAASRLRAFTATSVAGGERP